MVTYAVVFPRNCDKRLSTSQAIPAFFFANPMGFINRFFIIAEERDNDCYRLYIIMLISDR